MGEHTSHNYGNLVRDRQAIQGDKTSKQFIDPETGELITVVQDKKHLMNEKVYSRPRPQLENPENPFTAQNNFGYQAA